MSATVQFTLAPFQIGYCFTSPQQYANDIISLLTGTVNTTGKVIVSPNAPGPADQDAVWVRTVGGYLEGIYIYLGGWFRPHPIPASSNVRQIYTGTEASVWAFDGGDGTDPSVTPPTSTTGAMWQVDHNFDFKMPIGAGTNSVAYDGNPANSITQGGSTTSGGQSGEERHILTVPEIPPHTHLVHQGLVQHGTADHGVFQNTTSDGQADVVTGYGGGPSPGTNTINTSHQNLPPFLGVFFIKRTLRGFYQAS
ncbi:hypothetical protein KGP36_02615 [Patescibacteria group bacterium]|nr:hypothetical protein [Patescibacteria group bacterium]